MTETFAAGLFYGFFAGTLVQTISIYILISKINTKKEAENE